MTASQADYGDANDESQLVPGTLRVYRHFVVDTERGIIAPMSYRPVRRQPQLLHVHTLRIAVEYQPSHSAAGGLYKSRCTRHATWWTYTADEHIARTPHGKSPCKWCSCGFYACYKQSDDFYPGTYWGLDFFREVMAAEELGTVVIVRAVCEVSGRVVVGSRGVRAERMQIKALSIDWSKYRNPWGSDATVWRGYVPRHLFDAEPDPDEYDRVTARVADIASRYGVKFYDEKQEMYADHPEPDLSSLSIPAERRPEQWSSGSSAAWRALRSGRKRSPLADAELAKATGVVENLKKPLADVEKESDESG